MSQDNSSGDISNKDTGDISMSYFKDLVNTVRMLTVDAVEKAKSGHPGMPMGMADVATTLYAQFLKFYPDQPKHPNRDRLVLSAGHGSMLLYSLMYLTGYKDISLDDLKNFRQLGSPAAGHPEYGELAGIECTTGPLGQGFANAVGMAIAECRYAKILGDDIVDYKTYVICGDGCLMEGISHEAASLAGHLKLHKLIVLFDDNGISIDGNTSLTTSDDVEARFKSYGWQVLSIDGHDYPLISSALQKAKDSDRPTLICCKTVIGLGSPNKSNTEKCHGAPLGEEEVKQVRSQLDWNHPPFDIPDDILSIWRKIGQRNIVRNEEKARVFTDFLESERNIENILQILDKLKDQVCTNHPKEATRKSSGNVIECLSQHQISMIGGSADLTGSNNTKSSSYTPIDKDNFSGDYIHYGIREHAMVAIMNGLALSSNAIIYGGTFLVFSDYCRSSIRLAALMKQRVILVMTHDSIGLGEDGPTHQPVEHLASLRAMPNLNIYRPCDAYETIECWKSAITSMSPSMLVFIKAKSSVY